MKKIIFAALLAALCCGCAKQDALQMDSTVELRTLNAIVYYAAPDNYKQYETLDLLSGMHVSGETESYSRTITLGGNITLETLKRVRLEAVISSTATLEMADDQWNTLGYGLSEITELSPGTLRFVISDGQKSEKKYEISIRIKE